MEWPPHPLDTCSPQIRIGYSLRISLPWNSSWSFRGPSGRGVACRTRGLCCPKFPSDVSPCGDAFSSLWCDISVLEARLCLTVITSDCSCVSTTSMGGEHVALSRARHSPHGSSKVQQIHNHLYHSECLWIYCAFALSLPPKWKNMALVRS